jgi:O-antigen/teichoic acid export membrane protein
VGQVFLSQAAERYRTGTLPDLIQQASRKLFLYGLAVAALASLVLAPLMPVLFGKEWEPTRQIIPLLIPLFLGQLVVSPLSNAFTGSEKMRLGLFFQAAFMSIRIIPLLLFSFSRPFEFVLMIYTSAAGIGYFLYFIGIRYLIAIK